MSYVAIRGEELLENEADAAEVNAEDVIDDDRSALDKTIDKIGMGYYQWVLLALCGFGWMADNMWLQGLAVVLPRIQDHFQVSDQKIGFMSSSMFFGMMIGAVGWGTCADIMGRRIAFQSTLFFASIFGLLAPFMPNYGSLCLCFFFLGSAVGGSMPTDGTLFIENVPNAKRYLLTALSVFFSLGALVSSILGVIIIPGNSCPEGPDAPCDPRTQNLGWKYLLGVLGLFTLAMCLARIVLFRMRESPRYLVATGRPAEAVHSLNRIISYNGHALSVTLDDVDDSSRKVLPTDDQQNDASVSFGLAPANGEAGYQSTAHSPDPVLTNSYTYATPVEDSAPRLPSLSYPVTPPDEPVLDNLKLNGVLHGIRRIPFVGPPIVTWLGRMEKLFTPEWRQTTVFLWSVWALVALSYTMFNVYLPKLLEGRADRTGGGSARQTALREYLYYAAAGLPGALLGAWMIETRLGRKGSLILSMVVTSICTLAFVYARAEWLLVAVTMAISLAATTLWAVLYGMTPEIFTAEVRGSATGMASALSRIAGMLAPIIGGIFLAISTSVPIYASAAVSVAAVACAIPLPNDRPGHRRRGNVSGH